jgi:hypothetical protein
MVRPRSRRSDTSAGPLAHPATLSNSWRLIGRRSMTARARRCRGLSVPMNFDSSGMLGFGLPMESGELISGHPHKTLCTSSRPVQPSPDAMWPQPFRERFAASVYTPSVFRLVGVVGNLGRGEVGLGHQFQRGERWGELLWRECLALRLDFCIGCGRHGRALQTTLRNCGVW